MFEREFGIHKLSGLTFTGISRVYIGRKNQAYKLEQSPLANPFIIGKHGSREQVVESYRRWLWEQVKEGMTGKPNAAWDELKSLQAHAKKLMEKYDDCLTLTCWCKESELCHGDVIIRCLEWMNKNNL